MSESKVIIKKKSGKKKAVAVTLVIVLTAGGVGGAFYYKKNTAMKMPEEMKQAQSATAEIGTISDTITGTGNNPGSFCKRQGETDLCFLGKRKQSICLYETG